MQGGAVTYKITLKADRKTSVYYDAKWLNLDVPVVIYAETVKEALDKAEAVMPEQSPNWAYRTKSVEEVPDAPEPEPLVEIRYVTKFRKKGI